MARLLHPRLMSDFDPDRPCRVHDQLNDKIIDWDPAWALTSADRRGHEQGVVDGTACCSTVGSRSVPHT
jgi:hypothetical protein